MRVGLTGGIGSGKSEVARLLESFGALIVDTDQLAREAVSPNSDGLRQIARLWPAVIGPDGQLNRAALANVVFNDASAREKLNGIVHPHVRRLALERERSAKPGQMVVHVVPLLFETNYAALVDASIVVIAPDDERVRRVMLRDRAGEKDVRARMAAQIDPAQARRLATYVIENDGDITHLRERARAIYERILESPASPRGAL